MKKLLKNLEKSNIENKEVLRKLIENSEINENGTATFRKNIRLEKDEICKLIKVIEGLEDRKISERDGRLDDTVLDYMSGSEEWYNVMVKAREELHAEELEIITGRRIFLNFDLEELNEVIKNYIDEKVNEVVAEFKIDYRRF